MTDYSTAACADKWPLFDAVLDSGGGAQKRAERHAREVCAACPIRVRCLVDNWDNLGVVGGTTWAQRHPPQPSVERENCGTVSGHHAHWRHREIACRPCRNAKNENEAKRKREKRAREAM